jgi:hypothetical protein
MINLQHLALAQPRVSADEDVYVTPGGDAICAAHIFAHPPKQGQQDAGLDELMTVDCRAKGMHQVPQLVPLKLLDHNSLTLHEALGRPTYCL